MRWDTTWVHSENHFSQAVNFIGPSLVRVMERLISKAEILFQETPRSNKTFTGHKSYISDQG